MNITKTILAYRQQTPEEVLFKTDYPRVKDEVAITRHLIKYYLHRRGFTAQMQHNHLRSLSSGFERTSILHSLKIVGFQPIFKSMLNDLDKLITSNN